MLVGATATLAWALPLAGQAADPGSAGVLDVFATRADPALGRALGIAAQRGFWRSTEQSTTVVAGMLAIGVLLLAVAGLRVLWAGHGRIAARLAVLALIGWALAHGASGPTGFLYRWAYDAVPAWPLLREAHKAVALLAIATVVGLAAATSWIVDRAPRAAWAMVLSPLALLPTSPWSLHEDVRAGDAPTTWTEVHAVLAAEDPDAGTVVALPWRSYLRPVIAGERLVSNPTQTWLFSDAVVRTTAGIDAGSEREGDPRAAEVAAAVDPARPGTGARLADLGVRWVVLLRDAAGVELGLALDDDRDLVPVVDGEGVTLYRVVEAIPGS